VIGGSVVAVVAVPETVLMVVAVVPETVVDVVPDIVVL
jgi:hypothetical protein